MSQIAGDKTLRKQERIHRCSSLQSFARCIGILPESIPVSAEYFRARLSLLTPARTKLSRSRLRALRSALGFVLEYVGVGEGIRPRGRKLDRDFARLLCLIDNRWQRMSLKRFFSFCSRARVRPQQVDNCALRDFYQYLDTGCLTPYPARNITNTRLLWNRAALTYPEWPKTRLEFSVRPHRPLELEATLQKDIQEYGSFLAGHSRHPKIGEFIARPLLQSSIRHRLRLLVRYAGAAQSAGFRPHSVEELLSGRSLNAVDRYLHNNRQRLNLGHCRRERLDVALAAKRWALKEASPQMLKAVFFPFS
jgi:hypothetical protein